MKLLHNVTIPFLSCVMCRMSCVRYHMSSVGCQVSQVTSKKEKKEEKKEQGVGASRWRICYQWGLPRLVFLLISISMILYNCVDGISSDSFSSVSGNICRIYRKNIIFGRNNRCLCLMSSPFQFAGLLMNRIPTWCRSIGVKV